MKFARRREAGPGAASPEEAPDDGTTPPDGATVREFAGILDGQSLWVAVPARAGSLALRRAGTGEVLTLTDHAAPDQPDYLAARFDLGELPRPQGAEDQNRFDVVVVPGPGRAPLPVWTPPLHQHRPPPARDGRTQFHLDRAGDGTLQVRRSALPAAAVLQGLASGRDSVTLSSDGFGDQLALLTDDDVVLAAWPVASGTVVLTLHALDGVDPQLGLLKTGSDGAWRPVRRRANALPDPAKSVPLPTLYRGESEEPRARLRWGGRANLQLRVLDDSGSAGRPDGSDD